MKGAAIFVVALSVAGLWRETNSRAASSRGARAYEQQQYEAAAKAFQRAHELSPSPRTAFNLGTAQIAAGNREQGSATLLDAMNDPSLRANALFNRGNSALGAKAFDHAIRDFTDALKAQPNHAGAKRNLEIALARRESARKSAASGDKKNQPGADEEQQKPNPADGQQLPPKGEPNLEALLRSVQQQEQEELRRMKAKAGEAPVGW